MNLPEIQHELDADDFVTEFQAATAENPLDRLLIALKKPQDARDSCILDLAYIPVQDELDDVKLLQFFVALEDVESSALEETRRRLPLINQNIPLPAFNLHEEGSYLCFRYVLVLPEQSRGSQDAAVIRETLWLIFYLLNRYRETLQTVARGQQTVAGLSGNA